MKKLEEFINDVSSKNIFSYEHYKLMPLNKKIEIISLLNEYYKLKYDVELPKITVFIDCDGVILDTIGFSKKLLMEQYGINYDTHDRSNIEADKKVGEFFEKLDWVRVLHEASEINGSKTFINLFKNSSLYYPIIYSSVSSSREEQDKKAMFIDEFKAVNYKFCQAKQPKQCDDGKSILIDDDDFNLRYWNGMPIRFISNKPTIFPTIADLGEIYYLFPINGQSLDFNLPSIYDGYEQVMCPKTKKLEWIRRK